MSKKQMAVPISIEMVLVSTKVAAPVSTKTAAPSSTVAAPGSTAQPPQPADAPQLTLLPLPGVHL